MTVGILGIVIIIILIVRHVRHKRELQYENDGVSPRGEVSQWGGSNSLQSYQLPRATLPGTPMRFQNTVSMTPYGSLLGHHVNSYPAGGLVNPAGPGGHRRGASLDYGLQGPTAQLAGVSYYDQQPTTRNNPAIHDQHSSDEAINQIIGLDTFVVGSPSRQSLDVETGDDPVGDSPWGQARSGLHRNPPGDFEWADAALSSPRTASRLVSQEGYPGDTPLHRGPPHYSFLSNSAPRSTHPEHSQYRRDVARMRAAPYVAQRSDFPPRRNVRRRSVDSDDSRSTPSHETTVENLYDSGHVSRNPHNQHGDDALSLYDAVSTLFRGIVSC